MTNENEKKKSVKNRVIELQENGITSSKDLFDTLRKENFKMRDGRPTTLSSVYQAISTIRRAGGGTKIVLSKTKRPYTKRKNQMISIPIETERSKKKMIVIVADYEEGERLVEKWLNN